MRVKHGAAPWPGHRSESAWHLARRIREVWGTDIGKFDGPVDGDQTHMAVTSADSTDPAASQGFVHELTNSETLDLQTRRRLTAGLRHMHGGVKRSVMELE